MTQLTLNPLTICSLKLFSKHQTNWTRRPALHVLQLGDDPVYGAHDGRSDFCYGDDPDPSVQVALLPTRETLSHCSHSNLCTRFAPSSCPFFDTFFFGFYFVLAGQPFFEYLGKNWPESFVTHDVNLRVFLTSLELGDDFLNFSSFESAIPVINCHYKICRSHDNER